MAIRLNARSERPEERTFEFDPIERVRTERGEYLAAVFTIAKAFMAAGEKPKGVKVVAGFEEWSRLVQQPLMWLGMPDPLGNRETLRGLDDKGTGAGPAIGRVEEVPQGAGQGVHGSQACLDWLTRWNTETGETIVRPDLRELMSRNGKINERSFGRLLSRHRDRIRGGWCVVFARTAHKVSVYRLLGPNDAKQGELGV